MAGHLQAVLEIFVVGSIFLCLERIKMVSFLKQFPYPLHCNFNRIE